MTDKKQPPQNQPKPRPEILPKRETLANEKLTNREVPIEGGRVRKVSRIDAWPKPPKEK